ncbi:thioredoxin-like protein [Pterulicium gracile]|uniref:Thioredoxin-like protein n=1 Tax=Pterulicium gracile TaxID=1884261 RepID=A0A5C3QQN9_9AGAR|nr:thioredoxin-like protein [Pterula gracilis]
MELRAALHQLLLSFVLGYLCLQSVASAAIPTKSLLLTPDDFTSTTSTGNWYIEFFSPYCGHCKKFAPDWAKLVEQVEADPNMSIKMAQVDCAKYGDLCSANKVSGYPQMNFYHGGKHIDSYSGPRELDLLTKFLEEREEKYGKPKETPPPPPPPAPLEANTELPDAPALSKPSPRVFVNTAGLVNPITPDTFDHTIGQGPTFVKFYAPWCGHCKKLAPTWVNLAQHMQNKMNIVELNCDEYESFCKSKGVKGYPQLMYYANGAATEYSGGRKMGQLKEFTDKATSPAIVAVNLQDVDSRLAEHTSAFLFLHSSADSKPLADVENAAPALLGTVPVFSSTSASLFDRYSIPSTSWAILAFKNQNHAATFKPTPETTSADIKEWLVLNRLPAARELMQDTFQQTMNAEHHPLVVIVAVTPESRIAVSEKVVEIGKKWVKRKEGTDERWEKWMKSMYGVKATASVTDPLIVIAQHNNLLYADKDHNGQPIKFSGPTVFAAVEDALAGKLAFKSSENTVERMARYFSAKINVAEEYVRENPMRTILFVLVGGAVVFFLLVRWMSVDELGRDPLLAHLKTGRID